MLVAVVPGALLFCVGILLFSAGVLLSSAGVLLSSAGDCILFSIALVSLTIAPGNSHAVVY